MNLGIDEHVIVVTGGGSGIGEAITRASLEEGATVVVVGRFTDHVKQFRAQMQAANRRCDFFEADLKESEQCRSSVEYVKNRYRRIDGLVNNAGVNDCVGLANGSPEKFTESLRQNLVHYYAMTHYALPLLKESKGSIVNISSKVALT